MKLLLKNTKGNCNKEEKPEEDRFKYNFLLNFFLKYCKIKKIFNYLRVLSFLMRFMPTPDTARRSFSSAAITALVVLNPAS